MSSRTQRKPRKGRRRFSAAEMVQRQTPAAAPRALVGSVYLSGSVAPDRMKRTFNYVAKTRLNAPAGGLSSALFFSANGMYDPDRSLGGHQPLGFDQLMTLYEHFTVTHSKMTVILMSEDATAGRAVNQVVSLGLRDTTTGTTDVTQFIEQGRGTFGVLGSQNGRDSSCTLQLECDVAAFLGRENLLSDPECKGTVAADPAEEVFYEINVANLDGDDPPGCDMLVVIEYTAYLTEPRKLAQS